MNGHEILTEMQRYIAKRGVVRVPIEDVCRWADAIIDLGMDEPTSTSLGEWRSRYTAKALTADALKKRVAALEAMLVTACWGLHGDTHSSKMWKECSQCGNTIPAGKLAGTHADDCPVRALLTPKPEATS